MYPGPDKIRFCIMTWGSKAEVLEPESLREEIRAEAEKSVKRYKGRLLLRKRAPFIAPCRIILCRVVDLWECIIQNEQTSISDPFKKGIKYANPYTANNRLAS